MVGKLRRRRRVSGNLAECLESYPRFMRVEGATEATLRHKLKECRLFLKFREKAGRSLRV